MRQLEILNEIEYILKKLFNPNSSEINLDTDENSENENIKESRKKGPVKAIFDLIVSFFMSVIKSPFQLIHEFIKKEIIALIRKEIKFYFWLIVLLGVLFTIFIVFWILISLAIGVYFREDGASLLTSILYVISFQLLTFTLISIVFYRISRKIKSLKFIREF